MTIEDPSIPLKDFPTDDISDRIETDIHENTPLPAQKSFSLPNLFQSIPPLSKRFSKPNKINTQQQNIELSFFLNHQRERVHHYKDVNDIIELERCTQDVENSLAHIKFTPCVKKHFADFYQTLTEKEYEIRYKHIFSNLDETLCVFPDDFISRELRRQIQRMLKNTNDNLSVIDIFFFGKYPLGDRYITRKFSEETYTLDGKKKLQGEIQSYLDKIHAKIIELMETLECLKQHLIFPKKQIRAIGRIEAITSILKRPIPMMQNLKIATHLPLTPIEEKIKKTFNDKHKIESNQREDDLPAVENLSDLLTL